jgi:hypothetical protein
MGCETVDKQEQIITAVKTVLDQDQRLVFAFIYAIQVYVSSRAS